ncbi:hypothetical protein [Pseudomonas sp. NBRC 111142]|uniref:hypothetical protein n=1 Tax=Pseudomonas sp. NBRC 111142 TaxID=1661057 RepID=UPI0012E2D542|nr:hypothetical protein [Pseudomonas sp. NBRC 111142]
MAEQNEGDRGFHGLNPNQWKWGMASVQKKLRGMLKKSIWVRFYGYNLVFIDFLLCRGLLLRKVVRLRRGHRGTSPLPQEIPGVSGLATDLRAGTLR